jgi:hypothetical protein
MNLGGFSIYTSEQTNSGLTALRADVEKSQTFGAHLETQDLHRVQRLPVNSSFRAGVTGKEALPYMAVQPNEKTTAPRTSR